MAIEQGDGDDRAIMLIDCGLMFPDPDMHGVDLVLPDFTYLRENADRIVALIATHGHEDTSAASSSCSATSRASVISAPNRCRSTAPS